MNTNLLFSLIGLLIALIAIAIWVVALKRAAGKIKNMVAFLISVIVVCLLKAIVIIFREIGLISNNLIWLTRAADVIIALLICLGGVMMRAAIRIIDSKTTTR